MKASERLARVFWRRRWIFVVVLVAIVAVCGFFAPRVRPDNSIEAITLETDPTMLLLKRVEREFGSEEFISIAFRADNIFAATPLKAVRAISDQAAKIDGVERVLSLSTIWRLENLREEGEDQLLVQDFLKKDWFETGVPEAEIPELLKHPLYRNLIYSPDGKVAAVIVQLKVLGGDDQKRTDIITDIQRIIDGVQKHSGFTFHIWGNPIIHRGTFGIIEKEQNTMPAIMIFAVVALLYFSYRSFFIGISPLILMGVVFAIVVGVLGMFGVNFNWLTSIVPAIIMIVSVCDTMHVINEYLASHARGEKAVASIYRSVGLPSLVTGLTTAVGFLSLLTVPIKPVREFGLYVAFGVIVAFLLTFTVFVLILEYAPKRFRQTDPQRSHRWVRVLLDKSLALVLNHPRKILWVSAAVLAISVVGAVQTRVNTKMLDLFRKDIFHMREANDFLKQGAGGGVECYLLLESTIPGRFYDPEILKRMDTLETLVQGQVHEVLKSLSIVDFVKYFNQVLNGGDPAFYRIPDTREEVAQIFLIMEMERDRTQWHTFVNSDYSRARIRTFAQVADDSRRTLFIGDLVRQDLATILPKSQFPDLTVDFTGRPFATAHMMKYLSEAMMYSLITSAVTIMIILALLYRSAYIGLVASIPNLVTVVVGMGVMGFSGIEVNLATCMAFAIAMGIADDDMVHLVWHVRDHVWAGESYPEAMRKTFDEVGIPIVTSTVTLVGGFFMLCLSRIVPTTQLGILVGVCCIVALFGTILLAAAMILLIKPFKPKMVPVMAAAEGVEAPAPAVVSASVAPA